MIEILKVGGPVFAIAALALYFGFRLGVILLGGFTEALQAHTKALRELSQELRTAVEHVQHEQRARIYQARDRERQAP